MRIQGQSKGFTLLEVLVSLVILAVGLLGFAGMQARMIKLNQSASERSLAIMASYSMLDAIRANRAQALAGTYNLDQTCSVTKSSEGLAASDQQLWLATLKASLGNSDATCGAINCTSDGNCTVSIWWDDSRSGGSATQLFVVQSRV